MARRTVCACLLAAVGLFVGGSQVIAAAPSAKPTITTENDADHDGTFNATETIPSNAKYPWTVTYRLTIFGGTAPGPLGPFHKIVAITDDKASSIGTCQALVGTNINNNETKTCTYTVTLSGPGSEPLVNTATLTWDAGGNDTASNSSTVNFASKNKSKCNSGNGNGSDAIQFTDPTAHCYGGDPGNSYNAGNRGGDEIPTSGGNPNPGGNNVP